MLYNNHCFLQVSHDPLYYHHMMLWTSSSNAAIQSSRPKSWSRSTSQNSFLHPNWFYKQRHRDMLGCSKGLSVAPFCPGSQTSSSRWTWGGGARQTSCWCPRWRAAADPRTRPDPALWAAAERSHPDPKHTLQSSDINSTAVD